ncbi:MAG: MipA/OmpV family protein [Acidiferrobacterales bacterium]|nr:MipA/OmpV family protein [Acidiferrobacterales bacterium]
MNLTSRKSLVAATFSLLIAANSPSYSTNTSDAIGPGDSESKWVVGAAVGALKNPYVGENEDLWVSPTIRYNGERIFFNDEGLGVRITKNNAFSAGLLFTLDGGFLIDEDNYQDNLRLAGLNERDGTVLGGIYLNHDNNLGRLSFSALADAGNEHDGRLVQLRYTLDFNRGDWSINPEFGLEWMSADYVNHYVGVSESEATGSRLQFTAEDTFITFAGLRARYEFTEKWDINLRAGVNKLGTEFKDSPIIEDDLLYQASIGVNYNF